MALRRLLVLLAALAALAVATASAEAARFVHFESPSGNINCTVGPDGASCMARSQTWPHPPARPRSCNLEWAASEIDLDGTRIHLGSCRGDIGPLCIKGSIPCSTLGYGRAVTVGHVRCSSATAGVTCRRTDGRRVGFTVSRQGYRAYR